MITFLCTSMITSVCLEHNKKCVHGSVLFCDMIQFSSKEPAPNFCVTASSNERSPQGYLNVCTTCF